MWQGVGKWKEDIDRRVVRGDGSLIPALLLGNKVASPHTESPLFPLLNGFHTAEWVPHRRQVPPLLPLHAQSLERSIGTS
jgi:hypothetical protein